MRELRAILASLLLVFGLCGQADSASMTLMGVGGPAAGGGCSQATSFLARNGNAHPTDTTTLICGLVTDGVFAKLDALYVFATDTQAHALLSLVSATFNGATGGTIAFTANQGFASAGANGWVDTNFNPTTAVTPLFTQNSAHISVWDNAAGAGDTTAFNYIFGTAGNNGGTANLQPTATGGTQFIGALNNLNIANVGNTVAAGLYALDISNSTTIAGYRNGASVTSGSGASSASFNGDITFPYASFSSSDPIMAASIGQHMTATDHLNLCKRLNVYLISVAGISAGTC